MQGFPNDDIFEVIEFAFMQKSQRLALLAHNHCGNEVTVGIQRSEMRLRLDCHAYARNDVWVGHPHPNVIIHK